MTKTVRLTRYGGLLNRGVLSIAPRNDNARRRFEYRATDGALERRINGGEWESISAADMPRRGFHPILDPLKLR
jgi:hypothetical protein